MDRAELRVSVHHEDTASVITLTGELDMSNAEQLTEAVTAELGKKPPRLVLDLAELTFCDSRGLSALLMLNRTATAQQTYLAVRNPSPFFTRMLEVTGVASALNIA